MLSREQLIRESRARGGTWPALLFVYMILLGAMGATAWAIV